MLDLYVRCKRCSRLIAVEVPEQGFAQWQSGMLIQDAMPDVSVNDRELLTSHTCKACFNGRNQDEMLARS